MPLHVRVCAGMEGAEPGGCAAAQCRVSGAALPGVQHPSTSVHTKCHVQTRAFGCEREMGLGVHSLQPRAG